MHPTLFQVLVGGNLQIPHYIRYASLVTNPCVDVEASWDWKKNEEYHYLGVRQSAKLGVLVVVYDVQALV